MKRSVYLILFRGVGGTTQLPTKGLREKLREAGFENVATYINSGNAIVRSRLNRGQVISSIADLCREYFGFDKKIFARTLEEWNAVIANNPFAKAATCAPAKVHAALLDGTPGPEDVERIRALAMNGEDLQIINGVAYLHTPHGFGTCKMAGRFDKWIGVANTARNWNTVMKLSELAHAAAV